LRWEKKAERELTHKLRKLFKITFERTISKLQEMKSVPSSDILRKPLLFEIESLRKEFKEIISESVIESVNVGRERVLLFADSLAVETEMHFENLIMKQAIVEISLLEYSKQFEKLIRDSVFIASDATMDRIMGDITENLADSYVQGLGIGEASNRLKKVFDSIEDYRLERIARTEIQSYQNLGSHHTCIDLGVQYEQWWSARDERVRGSHSYLHGQIVRTGDRFSNGLMYPGDRGGPIEEWINCRCRLVPFLMPFGYTAPIGQPYFYEGDLISGLEEPEISDFDKATARIEDKIKTRKTEKGYILDDEGNVIYEKSGDRNRVQFNLKECEYFRGNIFIHNHPGASSFSGDDINIMIRYKMKEMRVIGVDHEGNVHKYIMKLRTPGVYPTGEKIRKDYKVVFKGRYSHYEKMYLNGEIEWEEAVIKMGNELWTEIIKKNKELIYISEII